MRILFLVNPVSGNGKYRLFEKALKKQVPFLKDTASWNIHYTICQGDACKVAFNSKDDYDVIVAVGGDGTVNEVASSMMNCDKLMGIIPVGSGNGLARHLKIPVNIKKSMDIIRNRRFIEMDAIEVNSNFCFNVCGVGFDAQVAHRFAGSGKRGFFKYIALTIREFIAYRPKKCFLEINGSQIELKPFLISIANSSQYGNNAFIAPGADVCDGKLDVCVLERFPWYASVIIAFHLFNGSLEKSKYFKKWQAAYCRLSFFEDVYGHIDGEPHIFPSISEFRIRKSVLRLIIP